METCCYKLLNKPSYIICVSPKHAFREAACWFITSATLFLDAPAVMHSTLQPTSAGIESIQAAVPWIEPLREVAGLGHRTGAHAPKPWRQLCDRLHKLCRWTSQETSQLVKPPAVVAKWRDGPLTKQVVSARSVATGGQRTSQPTSALGLAQIASIHPHRCSTSTKTAYRIATSCLLQSRQQLIFSV